MSVQQPVLTPPHDGEAVTSSGGSSIEPPLHTHSWDDELLYVVQGQLIAQFGDARVEVGPGAYAARPRGSDLFGRE
jgi:uncharacterized cupin superfamily protein